MKKYTIIASSLLLSVVLLFSTTAGAVSISVSVYAAATSINATLTNQYTVDYEMDSTDTNYPYGNYNVATYECNIPVVASSISVDSYINGVATGTITISPSAPTGATLASRSISFEPYSGNCFWSTAFNISTTNISCRVMFDNYNSENSTVLQIGVLHYYVSYRYPATPSNVPDPPPSVSVSISSSSTSSVGATPEPQDMGLCTVIKESIINALNDVDNPIQDILTYIQNTNSILTDIYNHNEQWYSAIVDELLTNNQWNSTITDYLIALYQELSLNTTTTINIASYTADLRSFMQTFPTWSAQMLQLLGKLADMNAAEQTEAAAIASQYDSLQQQQDDANAVVKAVPRPTFSASQFDSSNMVDTTQRQNFTGLLSLIVGNGYITRIFIIVVTFATAGFILFGKKK